MKYNIIYADPPWQVDAGPASSGSGIQWGRPNGGGGLTARKLAYKTMTVQEIKDLYVKSIASDNSHLYLWVINKYIPDAYDIAKEWGFKPSALLTWVKKPMGLGLGGAFVQTTEHLLYARRGSLKPVKRMDTTWFEHKRTKHSVKPQMFRDLIVEISGDLPRIELFARNNTDGWDIWGNEVNSLEIKLT